MIGLAVLIILIPRQAMVVPIFEWFNWLGWTGGSINLILCGIASGLGVVFFMQYFKQIPDELMEVSQVDGLSPFQTFILVLPLFFSCFSHMFSIAFHTLLAGPSAGVAFT